MNAYCAYLQFAMSTEVLKFPCRMLEAITETLLGYPALTIIFVAHELKTIIMPELERLIVI